MWKQTREGTEGDAYLCPDQGITIVRQVGDLDMLNAPRFDCCFCGLPFAVFVFFGCTTKTSMAQCPMQHHKTMARSGSYQTYWFYLVGTDLTHVALRGHRSELQIDGDIRSRRLKFVLSEADDNRPAQKLCFLHAWQTVWSGIEIYGSVKRY